MQDGGETPRRMPPERRRGPDRGAAPDPSALLDARRVRFRELVIAIVLLGGWVFRQLWVIPLVGVALGLGAAAGPRFSPLTRVWDDVIAPRVRQPVAEMEDAATLRFVDLLETGILASATVLMAVGITWVAWLLALVVAVWAALWSATGFSLPRRLHRRYGSTGPDVTPPPRGPRDPRPPRRPR